MASTIRNPQVGFVNLDHDQLMVLSDRRGSCVEVLFGGVWLTESNRPEDRFIEAGRCHRIGRRGQVVAAAIGRTGLRIVAAPVAGIGSRFKALLGSMKQHRPALAAHGVATLLALVMAIGLAELTARGFHGEGGLTHASIASLGDSTGAPV